MGRKEGGGGICWLCVPPAPLHVWPASPLPPRFIHSRNTARTACVSYLSRSPVSATSDYRGVETPGPKDAGRFTYAADKPRTQRRIVQELRGRSFRAQVDRQGETGEPKECRRGGARARGFESVLRKERGAGSAAGEGGAHMAWILVASERHRLPARPRSRRRRRGWEKGRGSAQCTARMYLR